MRPGPLTSPTAATKASLPTLARRWQQLQAELLQLDSHLQDLVAAAAPTAPRRGFLRPSVRHRAHPSVLGPHHRHRRNRGGDRRANHALWRIALVQMHCHPPTRAYVQRRTNQGLSKLDILRCLKRYLAREVYHHLTSLHPALPPLAQNSRHQLPHQHGHDRAERRACLASRSSHRLVDLATGWSSWSPWSSPSPNEGSVPALDVRTVLSRWVRIR